MQEYLQHAHKKTKYKPGGVERLFIDFCGAEDNPYNREVAKIVMVASVARVFEPGCKFDFAPILEGGQGIGKSTFIKRLDTWS
ncbi:VapE domain-containing protein [Sulfitobacter sp. JL08]|uniref:VapE domain-containing protein n=1 Tax=Sulfitobacter sp. JL08 TaxID=2070369 RepID=UPI0019666717|nr:VapE domain-containing protein [Sulfitobacter sp. JL08]